MGLLVLLLDCEDILLGSVRLFNSEHFTTLWQEYIRLFDEKAEATAVQFGAQAMFTEVSVCGNCHAVCKKLENILKTIFVAKGEAEARLHRKLRAREGSVPVQVGRLPSALHFDEPASTGMAKQGGSTLASIGDENLSQARSLLLSTSPDQLSVAQSLDYSHDCEPSLLDDRNSDADNNDNDNDNNDIDDDDDDDASILPIYQTNLGSEEQNIEESAHNIAERFNRQPSLLSKLPDIAAETTPLEASAKERVIRSTPSKKAFKSNGIQLSEFYPNIGCIFPAAYGQMTSRCKFYCTLFMFRCTITYLQ